MTLLFVKAYREDKDNGKVDLVLLLAWAYEIIDDLKADSPRPGQEISTILAFYEYPEGHAYA
jgi:hypothetical protein